MTKFFAALVVLFFCGTVFADQLPGTWVQWIVCTWISIAAWSFAAFLWLERWNREHSKKE